MEAENGFRRLVWSIKGNKCLFCGEGYSNQEKGRIGEGRERKKGGEGALERKKMEKIRGWKLEVKRMRMK